MLGDPAIADESGGSFQVAAEWLVLLHGQSGMSVGFIARFRLYFGDLFPNSLGKPLQKW